MSRRFGAIRQTAFVVRDIDATLRHWTETLGVGPFVVLRDIVPADWLYRGQPAAAPRLTIALGYSGDVQIELIQQHDENPSAYNDFLQAGREGFHHVSSWVTRPDYDLAMADSQAQGMVPVHQGTLAGAGIRFAYFDTGAAAPGGFYFEIAEVLEPPFLAGMLRLRDAALAWDGSDPIRTRFP